MTPIFCCGETLETYEAGKTAEWIESQITNGLLVYQTNKLLQWLSLTEPIWAIGTVNLQMLILQMKSGVVRSTVEKLYGKRSF